MKWKNALIEKPPQNDQEVLISVDGVYYIARYDAFQNVFKLRDSPEVHFSSDNNLVYWTEYTDPG
jgi:hypothetical protein